MNPNQFLAHNLLGILLKAQGDVNQAANHFSEALGLNPKLENAKKNLQALRARGGRGDADGEPSE